MATAQDYRDQLDARKSAVTAGVDEFVRGGYVTRNQGNEFLTFVGITVEDEETRAARLELEAFDVRVREGIAAARQRGLSDQYAQEAAHRFGVTL